MSYRAGWILAGAVVLAACGDDFSSSQPPTSPTTTTSQTTGGGGSGNVGGGTGGSGNVGGGTGGSGNVGGGTAGSGGSGSCASGTADCDQDGTCETNTTNDAAHCGSCGHDCLGASCVASVCEALLVTDPPEAAGPCTNGMLALDATTIYFTYQGMNESGVAKTPKATTSVTFVHQGVASDSPRGIAVDATHVYWVDTSAHELNRVAISGGSAVPIWTGTPGQPIALNGNGVYWFDDGNNAVMRADLSGANPTPLSTGQAAVSSMAVEGAELFWTTGSAVMSQDLDAVSAPVTLAQGLTNPKGIAVDATHVYWAEGVWDQPNNVVQRVARTGGAPELLASPGATAGAFRLALRDSDVYVADNFGGNIWRVPKVGGAIEILASSQPNPMDIAVDDVAVYWTSEMTAQVFKVAK